MVVDITIENGTTETVKTQDMVGLVVVVAVAVEGAAAGKVVPCIGIVSKVVNTIIRSTIRPASTLMPRIS